MAFRGVRERSIFAAPRTPRRAFATGTRSLPIRQFIVLRCLARVLRYQGVVFFGGAAGPLDRKAKSSSFPGLRSTVKVISSS